MLQNHHPSAIAGTAYGLNRRQFLQWSGGLGMGGMVRFRYPHAVPVPSLINGNDHENPQPGLHWQTLTQPAVTVDPDGVVIQASAVTVEVFEERLGHDVRLTMVKIPRGQARLGSVPAETGRFDHEPRPYDVVIPSFLMGMTPITQGVYTAVMGDNPSLKASSRGVERHLLQPEKPVVGIGWGDAIAFCHALRHRTGKPYRLPTEREWEYACRAGTPSPFHCGETLTGAIANYNSQIAYNSGPTQTAHHTTTPVGQFPPNAFGLYDMHGNVWEWCRQDGANVASAPSRCGSLRGGAWNSYPWICRSASRLPQGLGRGGNTIGLRVVCDLFSYFAT